MQAEQASLAARYRSSTQKCSNNPPHAPASRESVGLRFNLPHFKQ
jgi:hypothetical protein